MITQKSTNKKRIIKHLQVTEMPKNYDYITGNLFDYLYHQKYYKLIDFDLSRQTITGSSQEINFVGKLEEDNGTTTIFIVVTPKKKTILSFY